jgi:hypothetical protein
VVNQSKKPLQAWFAGTALIVLLVAFLVLSGRVTTASTKKLPSPSLWHMMLLALCWTQLYFRPILISEFNHH